MYFPCEFYTKEDMLIDYNKTAQWYCSNDNDDKTASHVSS